MTDRIEFSAGPKIITTAADPTRDEPVGTLALRHESGTAGLMVKVGPGVQGWSPVLPVSQDSRTYATVEELFFTSPPFALTAANGAALEVLLGAMPFAGRVDSLLFAPSIAAPSNTGTNGWKFRLRRKRLTYSGASSTRAVTSTDIGNLTYSKAWLQYEGVSVDAIAFSTLFAAANAGFLQSRDVLTCNIEAVGTPSEDCAGILTVRVVPT